MQNGAGRQRIASVGLEPQNYSSGERVVGPPRGTFDADWAATALRSNQPDLDFATSVRLMERPWELLRSRDLRGAELADHADSEDAITDAAAAVATEIAESSTSIAPDCRLTSRHAPPYRWLNAPWSRKTASAAASRSSCLFIGDHGIRSTSTTKSRPVARQRRFEARPRFPSGPAHFTSRDVRRWRARLTCAVAAIIRSNASACGRRPVARTAAVSCP